MQYREGRLLPHDKDTRPPTVPWQGQHAHPGPSGTKRPTGSPDLLSRTLTLHFRHVHLMTVAAACSLWMCLRVNQERTATGGQRQEGAQCSLKVLKSIHESEPALTQPRDLEVPVPWRHRWEQGRRPPQVQPGTVPRDSEGSELPASFHITSVFWGESFGLICLFNESTE